MLQRLAQQKRLQETLFMGALTLCCLGLSVFRFMYTETKVFLFLNWNLFLAFIPWVCTTMVLISPNIRKKSVTIVLLLATWLLFFPNAPYILTDLFHLWLKSAMPIWFDLVLILSFAWTGLLFGFLSLWDIERIAAKHIGPSRWIPLVSVVLLFVGSFGIYLGRYLRWSSWDIITEPFQLMYAIGERIINPFTHPRAWGMTLFMGLLLNILYWSFRLIRKRAYAPTT